MRNFLQQKAKKYSKRILLGFLSLMILGTINVSAQVSFTQTLNADFYKGAYNDLLVGSDNVYLPYQATDVNNWLTTTVLPQTLEGHKAATWNNRYVYVVGGYNDVTYSSSVYRATLTTGGISSWTTVNSLPVGLRDHAVVIGTNTIYVLGGRDDTNIYDEIYAATINSDGSLGTWDLLSVTLPETLWGHTAAYCGGYIYVVGGSNVMSSTYALPGVYYSEVQADNSLTSFATNVAMVEGRNGHSMVVHGTTFYILGGYNDFGNKKNTVLYNTSQLNGQLTVWSYATSLPIAISNHSSVIMNGLITVLAGESGGTLSNSIYYADINASPLVWNLATNIMYDRTKDGAAFATNGWIGYCGGENLSGTPIHNTRYANLTLSAGYEKNGFFVSNPFYELGAERLITELTFSASNPATSNTQIAYRTAGDDLDWGNWSALTSTSPITIGFTDHYLQYKIVFTGDGLVTPTFQEMNLWTPGTELAGNLNGWTTFDLASSPYWVTADISFTGGTHTFDAGVELNFLPQTGMSVSQANIICNGTVSDSVRFKGYTSEIGLWDGIYFDPNSDNGVSSQFYYTVIEGAGYGSWNANLYCNSTNEPLLMHCSLRGADGHGLNLNASHLTIEETFFGGNTESGVYLNNSNPSFLNSEMSNNQFAGIYLSSPASEPNFYTVLSENNTYAMYYPSPNFTILPPNGTGLTFTGNTYNGICIEEGNVSDNQVWNSIVYDYIMLGNLSIGKYGDVCRLTIEPGNTVKFLSGKYFMIGFHSGYHHGGELYAIGTVDSTITFTPHDGTSGGWEGIYFEDRSDYWGATSVMDYCLVEKGNAYNMFIENTTMPTILNSEIRDAVQDGIKCYAAYNSIETSTFSNNGRYPLYFAEPLTSPTLTGNTWTGNTINLIGYSGGAVNESRTLQNDGIGYHILGDINIGRYNDFRRLTVEPGLTLFFDPGTKIQVGFLSGYHHGGELYAEGTVGSPITFTSYDGVAGSWNGIYFEDRSDWSGATNSLKNCIIEKGNDYNIFCELTGSVTIDSCTIRDAVTDGLRYSGSYGSFTNSTFENNGRYPVYFMDWVSEPWHKDNTFNSKGINYIALAGGYYTDNRTIYSDNVEYLVLGSIFVGKYADKCRLTIEPDVTLNFDATIYLQVGYPSGYHYGGELYAEGNTDSLITFRPYNNAIGGWEGIYFEDRSDYSGATSSLKYCLIEKGDSYNVYCENTSQPTFENCELTNAAGDGLNCYNASPGIKKSTFSYNGDLGIYLDGSSNPDIGNDPNYTCNLFGNGPYEVYNNTANDIDARYNYWGTSDSAMIAQRIYDYYDNTAKGIVIFADFAQIPSMPTTTTLLSGNVWYNNVASTDMENALMEVFDSGGTPISTYTNGTGYYAFISFNSGYYTMDITPDDVWGGVNSTDALLILNHFAHIDTLEGMELAASDVNYSQTVNGTDALFVMKRYTGMISSFPSGDWLYNTENLTINSNQVVNDFAMLCFGDVNSSYTPAKKDEGSVWMVYEGTQVIQSFTAFDLTISIKDMIEAGAVSLGLFYPEEYMEITGAELLNTNGNEIFTTEDGLFRIAYADLNGVNYAAGDDMLVINCMAKDLTSMQEPIFIELYESSEFADPQAQVINDVTLAVPELVTLAVGINNVAGEGLWLSENYPNPFSNTTTIRYRIPEYGHVNLKVFDIRGTIVCELINSQQKKGEYSVEFSSDNLDPGIYFYKLEFSNSENHNSLVNKMSVTR